VICMELSRIKEKHTQVAYLYFRKEDDSYRIDKLMINYRLKYPMYKQG
jgi:hypothetical protein